MSFSTSWHALSLLGGEEYVVVGCVDTDSGRSGGAACPLGVRGDAWMDRARIMRPSDPPRHCRGLLYMKRYALLPRCHHPLRRKIGRYGDLSGFPDPAFTQAGRPVFKRSRISVNSFSSPDGPGAGAGGFLNRFTCLMMTKRQKAIIRNSITVLMNMP
jgi:hypothetical protein